MKHDPTIAQAEKRRKRVRRWQDRQRTPKRWKGAPDTICYRQTPLLRSEIDRLVADLKLEPDADRWMTRVELRELEGRAIAAAARSTLKAPKIT